MADDDNLCNAPVGRSFFDHDFLESLLRIMDTHGDDEDWIVQHLDCVHKVLQASLQIPRLAHLAINVFVKMFPVLLLTDDYAQSMNHSLEALMHAMNLKDANLLVQITGAIASFNTLKGNIRGLQSNVNSTLRHMNDVTDDDAKLTAYIRLIQAMFYYSYQGMPPGLFEDAKKLALMSSNVRLITELHLAISHAYTQLDYLDLGLDHARIALKLAEDNADKTFLIRATLQIGVAYRMMRNLPLAEEHIRRAMEMTDDEDFGRRRAYTITELASIYYQEGRYEKCEPLYLEAKAIYEKLKMPYMVIRTQHSLGMLWAMQGRFDEARAVLQAVMDEYRWTGYFFGMAEINCALGRCESRAGNKQAALQYLRAALGVANDLPPAPSRENLIEHIESWIDRTQNDDSGAA